MFCRRDAFGRPSDIFSQPADWEKAAEEEKRYQAAEQIRLMYVAATRAKNVLVVSTYAGNARIKPWLTIDEALAGVPELAAGFPGSAPSTVEGADGGPGGPADDEDRPRGIAARKREKADISTADVDRARKEIGANIRRAGQPGYAVESVTALAHKDKKPGERRGPGFGPVWGRLVHRVLEAIGSGQLNLEGARPVPGEYSRRGGIGFRGQGRAPGACRGHPGFAVLGAGHKSRQALF